MMQSGRQLNSRPRFCFLRHTKAVDGTLAPQQGLVRLPFQQFTATCTACFTQVSTADVLYAGYMPGILIITCTMRLAHRALTQPIAHSASNTVLGTLPEAC